jgi:hypothetical protein
VEGSLLTLSKLTSTKRALLIIHFDVMTERGLSPLHES